MKLFLEKKLSSRHGRQEIGYTIIEMMIAVAIVGLLVALSIPLYDRYQAKTRQSEAKLALSSLYVGEKGFYSEYSAYVASLDALHYMPEADRRFYTVGWNAVMTGTINSYSGVYTRHQYTKYNTPATFGCNVTEATAVLPAPTPSNAQTFKVGAAGEIRIGRGCDLWTVDEEKNVQNPITGH